MANFSSLKPHRAFIGWTLVALIAVSVLVVGPRLFRAGTAWVKGRQASEAGQAAAASAYMAEAARWLPSQPGLWEQAGRYALQAGEPELAIQDYLQAGQALSETGRLELAGAYRQVGDLASATRLLEEISLQASPPVEVVESLFELHRQSGDLPSALEDLRRLVELKPSDARLRYQLGLLTATQDPEAALAHLARAAELDPDLAVTVETLRQKISTARLPGDPAYLRTAAGQALASLDEWDLAAEAFYQAIVLRSDYAEAWAFLGEAYQHTDISLDHPTQDPLACLQKAVELDPQSLSAQTFLALYWSRQGDYRHALEALRTALRLDPNNSSLHVELGNTLALSGDLEEALQAHRRAIELAPGDVAVFQALIDFSIKYEYGLSEIALPAARQLVASSPDEPAALDRLAQVFIKLNDLSSAERFLLRALQSDSRYAPAHLHLGLLYAIRGQGTAVEELELARTLAPGSPVAEQANRLLQTYFP